MLFVSKKEMVKGREGTQVCERQLKYAKNRFKKLKYAKKIFAESHLTLLVVAEARRSCRLDAGGTWWKK